MGLLLLQRPDLDPERLQRTCEKMNSAVLNSLVEGYESLVDGLELPDPDDRHVLAAAIHCGADAIVTFNLRDFPSEVMERFNLEVLHPDDFHPVPARLQQCSDDNCGSPLPRAAKKPIENSRRVSRNPSATATL